MAGSNAEKLTRVEENYERKKENTMDLINSNETIPFLLVQVFIVFPP